MLNKNITSSLIVFFGQVLIAVTGLVTVRIMTEYLQPAEYGFLTLGVTFALIANQIIFGPLGAGLTRFFAAADELAESDAFLNAAITLAKYAAGIVLSLAAFAVAVLFMIGSIRWASLLGFGLLFSIASGLYSLINGVFLAKNAQKTLTVFQSSEPLARLAFAAIVISLIGSTAEAALVGYILGTFATMLFQMAKIKKTETLKNIIESGASSRWQEKILSYGTPYATWGIFTTINLASDRWVLQWTQGQDEVGLYAVLYQIGYLPVIMLVGIFAQLITPHLYKTAGDGTDTERLVKVFSVVKVALSACLCVTIILAVMGYFLHGILYEMFVSKKYESVSIYLPLMILAAGIFSSAQIASLKLHSGASTKKLIPIKIGTALIGVTLNIILGGLYGVFGIVVAQLIYSTSYLIWIVFLGSK